MLKRPHMESTGNKVVKSGVSVASYVKISRIGNGPGDVTSQLAVVLLAASRALIRLNPAQLETHR